MKKVIVLCFFSMLFLALHAEKQFTLKSPDGVLSTTIVIGEKLTYDICCNGNQVLMQSPISMILSDGTVWGEKPRLQKSKTASVDETVNSPFYRSKQLKNNYNALTLYFKKNWSIEFRAYNDAVAYRFISMQKSPFTIQNEEVNYCFPSDFVASVPYVKSGDDNSVESQFFNSFENTYTVANLSELNKNRLMFLPLVVDAGNGVKVCITESDLESYPGLYMQSSTEGNKLRGVHAPYPKTKEQGGHNMLQMVVKERETYIAKVDKPRSFPWRIAVVTTQDKNLAATNISYLLASPSRLDDTSWIKPGKVAWEWWNDWNIDGVDFTTGVNDDTYKAYIDFAAKNGIEYVILDEGWAVNLKADLMQVVKDIHLQELVDYAAKQHVGIILWAGYYAFDRDMENVCSHYAKMGVKGFKVDFMDRDDQEMVDFVYRAAETCAKYKLVLDLHGMYKPAGLNRTYPNILNFEGVHGLETMKWSSPEVDQIKYDAMIPFIRQVAGPMDYTQGAMINAVKANYYPCYSQPMSQGTRCHQLALYVTLDSPLNMLCDTPSNYNREPESKEFIAQIPTVWDETIFLDGKLGEYVITARRSGDVWYVSGITDWTARDIELDCSFLDDKSYTGDLFKDGVNAHRVGRDYKRESVQISKHTRLKIHLAPGGGFALKIQ